MSQHDLAQSLTLANMLTLRNLFKDDFNTWLSTMG